MMFGTPRTRILSFTTAAIILAGIIAWGLWHSKEPSDKRLLNIESVGMALCMYKLDTGNYPIALEALIASRAADGWNGPYITENNPTDQWGSAFRYARKLQGYELSSAGPDRKFDTTDDQALRRSE